MSTGLGGRKGRIITLTTLDVQSPRLPSLVDSSSLQRKGERWEDWLSSWSGCLTTAASRGPGPWGLTLSWVQSYLATAYVIREVRSGCSQVKIRLATHTGFPSWPRAWSMSHAQKLCSVAPWCLVWEWVRVGLNLTFLLEWPRQSETLPPIRLCTSALSSTSEGGGDQS